MSSSALGSPKKRLRAQTEEEDEEEVVCCGICYAESGVSIAGEIDCCSHHFCFVCIMEWAKHESRCPICRQRFSNVRRLPMHGVFSSSRDVKVPHRDQVLLSLHNSSSEIEIKILRPVHNVILELSDYS
uniref:RING-type domain-containing protein n=1 Tax=Glycine max TaxID=3847 RepID=C6TGV0_SOYBN|nr:unknown [Glycine max]